MPAISFKDVFTRVVTTTVATSVATGLFVTSANEAAAFSHTSPKESDAYLPTYVEELLQFYEADVSNSTVEPAETTTYKVKPGDTLTSLARRFQTDVKTLARINRIKDPHNLKIGKELNIVKTSGSVHQVENDQIEGENEVEGTTITWKDIADEYQVSLDHIKCLEANTSSTPQAGELFIITKETEQNQRDFKQLSRSAAATVENPSFKWPLEGKITSPYGPRSSGFHYGLDIAANQGAPIVAAAEGEVTYASSKGNYGLLVEIDHGNGWKSRYGHNNHIKVNVGEKINAGDTISTVGITGNATGPHLHFEIWNDGKRKDPKAYLPEKN